MELTLSIPGLLFPTISLLLLAYTNRFLTIATVIRNLHGQYREKADPKILPQLKNLRRRVRLIKYMQALGVFSIFLCVFCMFLIFNQYQVWARVVFGMSLLLLMASLSLSLSEIFLSSRALNLQLSDLEEEDKL